MRIIISGGGSGGHIFPAIAIADEIKKRNPESKILFVGAQGKMEMKKVPKAGYEIKGLDIRGFQRKLTLENFSVLLKLFGSIRKAKEIVKEFKPDIVVGVGGYASGPTLRVANRMKIPTLLQEQNSYAGLTNKLLAKKVRKICVAYEGLESYFPADKLVVTGNPVRQDLIESTMDSAEAKRKLSIDPSKKVILIFGGSQGAGTLNESMKQAVDIIKEQSDVHFIWQAGAYYIDKYKDCDTAGLNNVSISAFIDDMKVAYAASDLVVCRAGAITISELQVLAKPSILVPSPNVAEDHQTKNAMALVKASAAELVRDKGATEKLITKSIVMVNDDETLKTLSFAIKKMARPNAVRDIVNEIEKLIK